MVGSGRIASLDGLRGVAVILVILVHSRPDLFPGGWIGVDLFFVISGYLITRQLGGGRSVASFYAARVRRVVPPVAVTAGIVGAASLWLPERHYLAHFWTIAIEAGFYLLWPAVMAAPRRSWPALFAAMLAGLIAWRLAAAEVSYVAMHLDGLLWGALLSTTDLAKRLRPFAPVAAIGLFCGLLTTPPQGSHLAWALTIVPFLCAVVVAAEWRPPGMARMGLASFSLYLWHYPIVTALEASAIRGAWIWAAPLSAAIAMVSRRWVKPLGDRFAPAWSAAAPRETPGSHIPPGLLARLLSSL